MEDTRLTLSHEQQRAMQSYLDWLERARKEGVVVDAIERYYGNDANNLYTALVNGTEVSYPIFTRPEWLGLDGSINGFVGDVVHDRAVAHHEETIKGVAKEIYIRRHGANMRGEPAIFDLDDVLWNDGTYRATGFADPNDASLCVGQSDFYSYVSTAEGLLRELCHTLQTEKAIEDGLPEVDLDSRLPKRNEAANSFDDILDMGHHYHKVAPVCLLAVERLGQSPEIYLIRRSRRVLHEPRTYSVAPAGELTPDAGAGPDLQQAVIRELVEELLGVSERVNPDRTRTNEMERRVWSHVVTGQIAVERTALGFTADAPRPVPAGIVYVRDPSVGEWFREQLETNWEVKQLHRLELPLTGFPDEMATSDASHPGGFAFVEGVRRLNALGVNTGLDVEVESPR